MNKILCSENKGFNWYSDAGVYVKGFLFDPAGNYYENDALLRYFGDEDSYDSLKRKAASANGLFSVLIDSGDKLYILTDIIRSMPVFFRNTEGGWIIS
ncbi:hypothetical protein ACFLT1_08745, partial [Bacteroidota bacterium]